MSDYFFFNSIVRCNSIKNKNEKYYIYGLIAIL